MIRAEPCFKCGARGSCNHRTVEDVVLDPVPDRIDGRAAAAKAWGSKGASAGPARKRILKALKAYK